MLIGAMIARENKNKQYKPESIDDWKAWQVCHKGK